MFLMNIYITETHRFIDWKRKHLLKGQFKLVIKWIDDQERHYDGK
jgi:hypothetical protein